LADIRRSRVGPKVRLSDPELELLTRLVDDVDQLLMGGPDVDERPPSSSDQALSQTRGGQDPLVEITGLDLPAAQAVERPVDPALRRLLPDAYRDDEEASAEFRRYTDATLRGSKRADATMVRQALASIAVMGERVLDDEQTQAWLRFLTDARLVIASRLGIETADDAEQLEMLGLDDPRRIAYGVYEWLLAVLSDLLEAIDAS
jgi:hypothetical protein